MTDTPPILPDDDDDLLAAEYVTGLLTLADWNAASDRLRRDPGFAARVVDWASSQSPENHSLTQLCRLAAS